MSSIHTMVVGGGVIGLSLSWELAKRGFKVTLIEKAKLGQATSWAAAGILPPANRVSATDPMDVLRGFSHELFPRWCNELKTLTGIDSGLRRCGGWYLAETPGEHAAMIGMNEYWRELQIECERLDLSEVESREPMLADWCRQRKDHSAWWVPDEYQIRSPRLLQALIAACRSAGVELIEQANVCEVRADDHAAEIRIGERWMEAQNVVLCGGAHTGLIGSRQQLGKSIIPIRGQILLLKTSQPLFQTVVNVGHRYLIGRDDGHVLVGSCEEEVGFQEGTTDEVLTSLRHFADRVCPSLCDAETVKGWSGFRPLTFDGFPMIGRVPSHGNLFIASGHFRSGIHLAPATAVTLADTMTGATPQVDLEPFRVGKQQSSDSRIDST